MRFRGALFVPLAALAPLACATLPHAASSKATALHASAARAPADPTVRDVRFVPMAIHDERTFGRDPGGGVRAIEDGVRVVSLPGGAMLTADDRLPTTASTPLVTELPERLGGGFLFVVDETHVWRADGWLEPARPIYTSRSSFLANGRFNGGIVAGLDRVYVRTGAGIPSWRAIDGTTGKEMPLGPWPASPAVGAYAAVDGWRAIAIADLRGTVATFDAGATWSAIHLPMDARDATAIGDAFDVRGIDASGSEVHYEVRADGQIARGPDARDTATVLVVDAAARDPSGPLGASPLAAAIEDGWPAGDGTAIVARNGAIARVRLDDGSIEEVAPGAYPLRPSRCHPIALGVASPATTSPGVGFVCGEPRGATVIYAFDPATGRLDEARRFDAPRAILASGNGALAVRGPCDASSPSDARPGASATHDYCVRARSGAWREIHVEGGGGGERVVVLADGRVAIVSPPEGNLGAARFTLLEGERTRSVAVVFPKLTVEVQRVLDVGVWLDGFEERRPGVVGGWVEAGGTMLGVEIDLSGVARFGEYIRDAGRPMVSGRYGLGWSDSRLGRETTDGGMTWTPIEVPAPIAPARAIASRACGPVGCTAAGWMRVGWGETKSAGPFKPPYLRPLAPKRAVALELACSVTPEAAHGASRDPFVAFPIPTTSSDQALLTYETTLSRTYGSSVPYDASLARVYAWGPKAGGGDWEHVAKWSVRWVWPFGGGADARATIASPAPALIAAVQRLGATAMPLRWSILSGDDASHALLLAHRKRDETSVFEIEADRAPVEIARADGEPFGEIDSAIRAGGRWYFATSPRQDERREAAVWEIDGPAARELTRIPRWSERATLGRLAWRGDGKAIGFVVDGAPASDRWSGSRWVAPIDLDSGSLGEVESLGAQDFGDRASLEACASDDTGWTIDVPAQIPIAVSTANERSPLRSPFARVRIEGARACLEKLSGTVESLPSDRATSAHIARTSTPTSPTSLSVALAANGGHERRSIRCSVR